MKKVFTLVIIAFFMVAAFSTQSCKKCTTCSYTYQAPGGTDILTYTYPELCGNSSDIDDYKNACGAAAAAYGNSCNCVDN